MISRAFSDLALSTYAAKNHYQRKRPFQQNNEPLGVPDARAFLEKDPSYPSGHTAVGWGFALILSEIAPDRAEEILNRGRAFGESRMVFNHHWYSDVVWGRFMGAATVARLHADPTFRADLEAAKAEVAAMRSKNFAPTVDCKAEASALALGYQTDDVTAIDILLSPDATMRVTPRRRTPSVRFTPRVSRLMRLTFRTSRYCSVSSVRRISTRSMLPQTKSWRAST